MIQSITFGSKNTWDDWKLLAKERPVFAPPKVKTTYIDIPGGNGSIDLSQSLTGYPIYENRTGSFKFRVMNGYAEWQDRYSEIMNYLHGKKMKAVLADDPDYYYYGRFTVDSWDSGDTWSEITIGYEVEPYKWGETSVRSFICSESEGEWYDEGEDWLCDNYAPVYPTFTSSEATYIRFVNETWDIDTTFYLEENTQTEMPDCLIYAKEDFCVYVLGTGSEFVVKIEMPNGRL